MVQNVNTHVAKRPAEYGLHVTHKDRMIVAFISGDSISNNSGKVIVSDINKEVDLDIRRLRLRLKGLIYYDLIEKKEDGYTINEGGEKVWVILCEISKLLENCS